MLNYSQLAVTSVTALVVALLSAWVTVQLAYRRFRTEKWWERRFDTYDRIIDALYRTKVVWDNDLKAAARGSDLSNEEERDQIAQYDRAKGEIERAVVLGEYVLGSAARMRLQEYRARINQTDGSDWLALMIDSANATSECLDDVIRLARRDLGATDPSRWVRLRKRKATAKDTPSA